jgi:Antidote-toxin recognition MazE, bacterial antitoxin
MPYNPKVRLTKGNSFRVTIPMDIIQELGWRAGDILRRRKMKR